MKNAMAIENDRKSFFYDHECIEVLFHAGIIVYDIIFEIFNNYYLIMHSTQGLVNHTFYRI
jgi:hypothetical protein